MIDKTQQITDFIKSNFSPATLENTSEELQLQSHELLTKLFQIFPVGCIDDYDLHEILTQLGYKPQKRNTLDFVWCLKEHESYF